MHDASRPDRPGIRIDTTTSTARSNSAMVFACWKVFSGQRHLFGSHELASTTPIVHAADPSGMPTSSNHADIAVYTNYVRNADEGTGAEASSDAAFEHLCATLLQQSHLCPVPLEAQPVYWRCACFFFYLLSSVILACKNFLM